MKKRINVIIELIVLLALCVGIALVVSKNQEEASAGNFGIVPSDDQPTLVDGQELTTVWNFDEGMTALAEEKLLAPVREKYGIVVLAEDGFSRCSSSVSTSLSGETGDVYVDGYYYGVLHVSMGCDSGYQYKFRVDAMGNTFEIANADGTYVPVEDWEKPE